MSEKSIVVRRTEVSGLNRSEKPVVPESGGGRDVSVHRLFLGVDADYFFPASAYFKKYSDRGRYLDVRGIKAFASTAWAALSNVSRTDVTVAESIFYASTVFEDGDMLQMQRDRSFEVSLFGAGYVKISDSASWQKPNIDPKNADGRVRSSFLALDIYTRIEEGCYDGLVLFSGFGSMAPLVAKLAARLGVPTLVLGMHAEYSRFDGDERRLRTSTALSGASWHTLYLNLFAECEENESMAQLLFCPIAEGKSVGPDLHPDKVSSPAPGENGSCCRLPPRDLGFVKAGLEKSCDDWARCESDDIFMQGRRSSIEDDKLVPYGMRLLGRVLRFGRRSTYLFVRASQFVDGSPIGDGGEYMDFFLHLSNFSGTPEEWDGLELNDPLTFVMGVKSENDAFAEALDVRLLPREPKDGV